MPLKRFDLLLLSSCCLFAVRSLYVGRNRYVLAFVHHFFPVVYDWWRSTCCWKKKFFFPLQSDLRSILIFLPPIVLSLVLGRYFFFFWFVSGMIRYPYTSICPSLNARSMYLYPSVDSHLQYTDSTHFKEKEFKNTKQLDCSHCLKRVMLAAPCRLQRQQSAAFTRFTWCKSGNASFREKQTIIAFFIMANGAVSF